MQQDVDCTAKYAIIVQQYVCVTATDAPSTAADAIFYKKSLLVMHQACIILPTESHITNMPLTNHNSYVPTMNEFIAHWGQVDAVLTPDLTVPADAGNALNLGAFTALRDDLLAQFQTIVGFLNDQEIARGEIRLRKERLLALFNEFNAMLDGYWAGTGFINARALAPSLTDGAENFLKPMRDARSLWDKLNAAAAPAGITLPLTLADGTVADNFSDLITELQEVYAAEALANQNAVLARSERDAIMDKARSVMVNYRKILPARCAQHPTLVDTLPTLTPPPGHTPQPVTVSTAFEAPNKARLRHSLSNEATIVRYELRGNPGDTYDANSATTIDTHDPTDDPEFVTEFGLVRPGSRAAFKVFVVLENGNEAGSVTAVVEWPL